MKVLIISANSLAAAPTGPAYIAGAARRAGHSVEVFECLFAQDMDCELKACIARFQPDVIGISIRLVHAYIIDAEERYNTRHLDLRENVRQVVDIARQATNAPIILGGPGFNYYARDWLEYLGLDYGIRGEADFSFPRYLDLLEKGGDITTVPGCAYRRDGQIHKNPRERVECLDDTALPAYDLFDLERYQQHGISPGILTKRGCAFRCTYCPYHSMEGARYRLKSAARVVDEIEHIQRISSPKMIVFCENNFNVPKRHAEAICQEIIDRKLKVRWGTGDLRPMGITGEFCSLLRDSGCDYVNLSIESGSDRMLKSMRRGYTAADVRQSLDCLEKSGIPYGASLMFGAPGENPETVKESLALLDRYPVPLGTWVTIGICLWTEHQEVLAEARRAGQLGQETDGGVLFEATNYLSPDLPKQFVEELVETLRKKDGYSCQANQPYAGYQWAS